jgi:hypothetical protein
MMTAKVRAFANFVQALLGKIVVRPINPTSCRHHLPRGHRFGSAMSGNLRQPSKSKGGGAGSP